MNLKEAAVELLKVADLLEKDAAEVTQFVCAKCNHTATLASINGKRQSDAKTASAVAADITVNDKVHCPACGGKMAYKATEASEKFYFDPEKKAEEKKADDEKKPEEKEEKPEEKKAPADYDSL